VVFTKWWLAGVIYIAFFADTPLSLSVYCAVVVSYKTFVLSARESIPVCSCCMTVPISVWPVVLTHTHAVFHVLRWVLPPLMSHTFQCVTAMCFSPQESTEGPCIQVRESCQGHSSAWIPAVAHGVLQCVIRTLFLNCCVLFGILDNGQWTNCINWVILRMDRGVPTESSIVICPAE